MKTTNFLIALFLMALSANLATAQSVKVKGGSCGDNLTWNITGTTDNYTLAISGMGAMKNNKPAIIGIMPSYKKRKHSILSRPSESETIYASPSPSDVPWHSYRSGIKTILLIGSITSIEEYAFSNCSGLTSVIIPNTVNSIGRAAFGNCSGLTSISIPNSVTSIGESAFGGCSGLTSVTIPNSVISIGRGAFSGCSGLTSIKVSGSHFKFANNVGAAKVLIPYSDVGLNSNCSNVVGSLAIGNLTIPNSVTSIGSYAFSGCSGLTSVTIPNSVISIGKSAFSCSLSSIKVLATTPPTLKDDSFCVSSNSIFYVPCSSLDTYKVVYGWSNFQYGACIPQI
jgi:hypothetical protein